MDCAVGGLRRLHLMADITAHRRDETHKAGDV